MKAAFESINNQYDYLYIDPLSSLGFEDLLLVTQEQDLSDIDIFFMTNPTSKLADSLVQDEVTVIVLLEYPAKITYRFDAVCVSSPRCKTDLIQLGIPHNKIFVTGIIRLDRYMPLATVSINKTKKILRANLLSKEKFDDAVGCSGKPLIVYSPATEQDSTVFVTEALAEVASNLNCSTLAYRQPLYYNITLLSDNT